MEPFYFGVPERRLFGVFHPAEGALHHELAIVVCQPVGMEYECSHRALVHLSEALSRKGFPVFRFDYFGCGDSDGESGECSLEGMLADLASAVEELSAGCGASRIGLLGLRLGASLAWMYASRQGSIDSLALWLPVAEGKRYLRQLARSQRRLARESGITLAPAAPAQDRGAPEFPLLSMPHSLTAQIQGLDLPAATLRGVRHLLLLHREDQAEEVRALRAAAEEGGTSTELQSLGGARFWDSLEVVVPLREIEQLVARLEERWP